MGYEALGGSIAGGEYNVAVGNYTLDALTSAGQSVAVGYNAGSAITTGGNNTTVGYLAGDSITTGAQNIIIGSNTDTGAVDATYQYVIGYNITATEDSQFIFGRPSNTVANEFDTDNAWTRSSDVRKKKNIKNSTLGLNFINDLRPVTFEWKPNNQFPKDFSEYNEENYMTLDVTMHGMIAQEVKSALDNAEVNDFGGWKEDKDGSQRISQEMFVYPLIKAVQELSAQVTTLQQELKTIKGE